jgi:L-ascorbate metabolism protein UlaG (beta-lactamase superfamily)
MLTRSDHCDGLRFFNPGEPDRNSAWRVLRWLLFQRRTAWPGRVVDGDPGLLPSPTAGGVDATWVGHATFLVRVAGLHVLTDPMWSERASPLRWAGPRRVRRPGLPFEALPPIDLVLLSHNHYDHLDLPTLRRLRRACDPLVLTPLGNARLVRRAGLRRIAELDWWQKATAGTAEVTLTPARHFSRRHLWDRNRALWGGFVLRAGGRSVFFAGDSAYGGHFAEVRRRLGPPDLALLPIGAYEPSWFMRFAHVSPEEAVQAHHDLAPRLSVAMHFGTFKLTDEPIDEPPARLRAALAERGVAPSAFVVPACGETVTLQAPPLAGGRSPTQSSSAGLPFSP